jgi:RND family efflux transporter MFP subunit
MKTLTRKQRCIAVSACALAVLLATGAAIASSTWNAAVDQPPEEAKASAMLVKTATIKELMHPIATQTFVGQLVGRYNSKLAFRVSGKIASRLVEVGQSVKAGQVLYELEPEDLDLQLATALANEKAADAAVVQAQQEEQRMADLVLKHTVSQSEYDNIRLLLDSSIAKQTAAKKQAELARRQRSYAALSAEADGIVTAIRAEVGQVVTTGDPVLDMVRSDELEVEVNLPEQFTDRSRIEYAEVSFWNHPDKRLMLRLREISPLADTSARTFRARYSFTDSVQVPQHDGECWMIRDVPVKLGMTANILFGQSSSQSLVAIPATAVGQWQGKTVVWSLVDFDPKSEQDTYSLKPIEVVIEQLDDTTVHVSADAISDKTIVMAGVHKLTDDSLVRRWKK